MGTDEELGDLLDRLRDAPGHPLRGYANPQRSEPPFHVTLAAFATELAAELDARFGGLVVLEVGHFQYPARTPRSIRPSRPRPSLLDPLGVEVTPVDDLELRSGHDLRSSLLIQNLGELPLTIRTNRVLQSAIVDPISGEVSGSYAGPQSALLRRFQVDPGHTDSIPVLIGSASLRPELGYAVPPGLWAFEAFLDLEGDGLYRSPRMPLTIVG